MQLTISRTYAQTATTGQLPLPGRLLYTIEAPWRNNEPEHSCVPPGLYELVPYLSPKHGNTYALRNPALKIMGTDTLSLEQISGGYRSFCELHAANFAEQLEGCIAFGLTDEYMFNPLTGLIEVAVQQSRIAVSELLAVLGAGQEGHTLMITGVPPDA